MADALVKPGAAFEIGIDSWECGFRHIEGLCFKGSACPRTLRDYFNTVFSSFGDRTFIVYEHERLTYTQVWERASAVANYLVKEHQVRKGDRVGVCLRNYPEWLIAFIAATSVGAIAVPMNSLWKMEELAYGLEDSGTKVVFCDPQRLKLSAPAIERFGVRPILVRGGSIDTTSLSNVAMFEDIVQLYKGQPMPPNTAGHDDAACIMYTSGSTGFPKGVVLTHRGVCNQISMNLLAGALSPQPSGATPQECMILPVPLFHVTATHHIFLSIMSSGGKLVLMYKWDAGVALQLIQAERPTRWTGVPTMVQDLMEHEDFDKYDTSSLRSIGGGGGPTPASQVTKSAKAFKGGVPGQGYGLTETNGGVCFNSGDEYLARPTSCGKAYPVVQTCVVAVDGGRVALAPGSVGELLIRSPLVMSHYWNKRPKTEDTIVEVKGLGPGWFRTGDIGRVDTEGFVYILDRAKDIIIRGGENISCAEVEEAFYAHTAVMEVAAFGIKDERLGERVGLTLVFKRGQSATTAALVAFAREKIANFKTPAAQDVFISQTTLPRGATGKILKRVIRSRINKELEQKKVQRSRL